MAHAPHRHPLRARHSGLPVRVAGMRQSGSRDRGGKRQVSEMKDKIITLVGLCFLGLMLGTVLDGAKAQNASNYGMGGWTKSARELAIMRCMKLDDISDVRKCVEKISDG